MKNKSAVSKEEQKIIDEALQESRIRQSEVRATEQITAILKAEGCCLVPRQSFSTLEILDGQIRFGNPVAEVLILNTERKK